MQTEIVVFVVVRGSRLEYHDVPARLTTAQIRGIPAADQRVGFVNGIHYDDEVRSYIPPLLSIQDQIAYSMPVKARDERGHGILLEHPKGRAGFGYRDMPTQPGAGVHEWNAQRGHTEESQEK